MIDPHELRIGNLVLRQWDKLTPQPTGYRTKVHKMVTVTRQECHKWDPLPLTSEMLLNNGFEQDSCQVFWFALLEPIFNLEPVYQGQGFELVWDKANVGVVIKYVHQLQDVFYFFTGHELEINP